VSERQLRDFLEEVDRDAVRAFRRHDGLRPFWHLVTRDGRNIIVPVVFARPKDKDVAVAMIREIARREDVVLSVFVGEAWTKLYDAKTHSLDQVREEFDKNRGLSEDPERIEIVSYYLEDADGCLMAQREIKRDRGKKPRLCDLKFTQAKYAEGRMLGQLPTQGRAN
jgi:hypothetical protein